MDGIMDRPYYFNRNIANRIKVILGISLGFFLFLVLFNPFEFNNIEEGSKVYYFLGFGLFTMLVLGLDMLVLPNIFNRNFLRTKWKVKHEIVWNVWILLSLAGSYYGFICITKILPVTYETLINLFLLALLPVVVLITINQDAALRRYLGNVIELSKKQKSLESANQELPLMHSFISDNKKEKLAIDLRDLLYFSSTGNYVNVVWYREDAVKKKLIRGTIQENIQPLSKIEFITQVHRSYVVNINMINSISGNSKSGFKLRLKHTLEEIPVSRRFIKKVRLLHSRQKIIF